MEINETIYKKDTKGKTRCLIVNTYLGTLTQTSGVIGTDNPVIHSKFCEGKNTGRSNETSNQEQAIKQAEALVKDKLTRGYFMTIEETETEEVVLPMLAYDFFNLKKKINWKDNWYVQPKFDGIRCLAFITAEGDVTLMSRSGKEITTMDHIKKELSSIKQDIVLDGELYVHGEDFQENIRFIKKYRVGQSERIDYHVYDVIKQSNFQERHELVDRLLNAGIAFKSVKSVETYVCPDADSLKLFHFKFLSEGYEGTMLRKRSSQYKVNGRSQDLLKYKDFKDVALPIYAICPDDADPTMGSPVYYWEGATGHKMGENIMGSGIRASHEKRREMLSNEQNYIGKIYEVRFFEYSNKGVPRFPITIAERIDK
jgi:ATP-dependent DNA ligase